MGFGKVRPVSELEVFSAEERERLSDVEAKLAVRMKEAKKRHVHTLGVAACATEMAKVYGVDQYEAALAGLLHDWDKVIPDDELVARALHYGVPIVGAPALAAPLLHGPVAAYELPQLIPDLPQTVLQAISRHTVGACDMTPLDMVVFVADAIEPGRRGDYADRLREQVGTITLDELFFQCFAQGLVYVINTGRYLYPTALDIYNHYACLRDNKKGLA